MWVKISHIIPRKSTARAWLLSTQLAEKPSFCAESGYCCLPARAQLRAAARCRCCKNTVNLVADATQPRQIQKTEVAGVGTNGALAVAALHRRRSTAAR